MKKEDIYVPKSVSKHEFKREYRLKSDQPLSNFQQYINYPTINTLDKAYKKFEGYLCMYHPIEQGWNNYAWGVARLFSPQNFTSGKIAVWCAWRTTPLRALKVDYVGLTGHPLKYFPLYQLRFFKIKSYEWNKVT